MRRFQLGDQTAEIGVVVFDKDGLLFDSVLFWQELATARGKALSRYLSPDLVREWQRLFGAELSGDRVTGMDPKGILAVASPAEEIAVTAGLFLRRLGISWTKARDLARQVYAESDDLVDLGQALSPRKGFPEIFRRLRAAGVPYGVATSDTLRRVRESVNRFDDFSALDFVVTPEDVEKGKPDPDMLQLIAGRTGVAPENILMVGDSYVDVAMAAAAGAVGVGIPSEPDMEAQMRPYAAAILPDLDAIQIVG